MDSNEVANVFINKQRVLIDQVTTEKLYAESQLEIVVKQLQKFQEQVKASNDQAEEARAKVVEIQNQLDDSRRTAASQGQQIEELLAEAVRYRQEISSRTENETDLSSELTKVRFERDRLVDELKRTQMELGQLKNTIVNTIEINTPKKAARRAPAG